MKISCIVNKTVKPMFGTRHERQIEEFIACTPEEHPKVYIEFERKVFNYLLKNKDTLGISKVYRLRSSGADGLLELDSGETVLLEIKYALGWAKCCQSRIQFQRFLTEKLYGRFSVRKPESGLIVFNRFSGDWAKRGWDYFYEEENVLNESLINTHIVQLTDSGDLISYPGKATDSKLKKQ